jgi:hypothetical protein
MVERRHTDTQGLFTLVYQWIVSCKSPNDNSNDSHEDDDDDDDNDDDDKTKTKQVPRRPGYRGRQDVGSENKNCASLVWSVRNN